jgi:phosphoglycolate phosphatase
MSSFDTLLFDLDGTLIDSLADLTTSINLLRDEHDLPPLDRPTVASYVGDGASLLVRRALPEGFYRSRHLERFMAIYAEHLSDATAPFPGIIPFLEACRDKALAVVTNKPIAPTLELLERLELRRFFPVVVGGDSAPTKKPDPGPVRLALSQLGRLPADAVMIGDHVNDLLAGRAAGTLTCFCAWGTGDHRDAPHDLEAAAPADLGRLFLRDA